MDKEELRKEKLIHEHTEEKFREENEIEFFVKFKGSTYITALDKGEAEEKLKDIPDLSEWLDVVDVQE